MRKKNLAVAAILILIVVMITLVSKWLVHKIYPLNYNEHIKKYSKEYKLDTFLVAALIKAESNFQLAAKSHKSANGLMQITGDTGKWIASKMNIENYSEAMLYDAETNIKMGCWYLNNLREEFGDNVDLILAAYNAGRGNVNNWLQNQNYSSDGKNLNIIPFKETDQYVKKIETNYNIYKFLYKEELQID